MRRRMRKKNNGFSHFLIITAAITMLFTACKLGEDMETIMGLVAGYKVTFNSNGGSGVSTQTIKSGETATRPNNPTKSEHSFDNWYSNTDLSVPYSFDTPVTNDITLHAKWNVVYTVTFSRNGGDTDASPQTKTVTSPATTVVTLPNSPTREGYTLTGWNTQANGLGTPFTATTPVTASITVYAQWEPLPPDSFTVTFNRNGGDTEANPQTKTVTSPATTVVTLPNSPTRTGYTLTGWNTQADGFGTPFTAATPVTEHLTVHAQWAPETYQITYRDVGNGTFSGIHGNGYPVTHTYDTATALVSPTRANHAFGGWFINSSGMGTALTSLSAKGYTADITLYAKWDVVYTVTFTADGGSPAPTQQVVASDGKVTEPTAMTRSGFTFDGWYQESTFVTRWNFTTDTVTNNITLYARWVATGTQFAVAFVPDGGSPSPNSPVTIGYGEKVPEPAAMTRSGFTFDGWYRESTFATRWNFDTDIVTGNTTLHAKWGYTVTFTANSGSPAPAGQIVISGGKVTEPAAMTRSGYTFGGWYRESTFVNKWDFDTNTVTGNNTLYAKWFRTVTFNANSATSGTVPAAREVAADTATTLPSQGTLSRTGYTFAGWNTNATGTGTNYSANDSYTPTSAAVTLYARWTYTVTYNINNGTGTTPAAQTANAGTSVTLASGSGFSRSGYTFGGWNTNATGTGTNYNAVSSYYGSNITLFAKWGYAVTFTANEGTPVPAQQIVVSGGKVTEPAAMTRTGYTFIGWYRESAFATKWNFAVDTVTDNTALHAKWGYAVSFAANSGTPAPTQQVVDIGGKITEPAAMTRTGYAFIGWYRESTFVNKWDFASDTVTGTTTLYAKWDTTYTVTFTANSGTPAPAQQVVVSGSKVTEPDAMTRAGYTFDGWYRESYFSTRWDFASDTVTGTTTLYAKWDTTYTITFTANSGTPAPDQQVVVTGGRVTEPDSMTRTGYTFGGWYRESTFNTRWNFDTSTVTGNITLYAKWYRTVTFDANDATSGTTPAVREVTAGSATTLPTVGSLARTGYTFGGWNINAAGTGTNYNANASYTPDEETVTLYARWTYTVTYNINNGTGTTPAAQTDNAGTGVTLASGSGFSRSGYAFAGWNTYASGAGTDYNAGSWYPGGNTTLYAKWGYTVTFDANDGSPAPSGQIVMNGDKVTEPDAMTRAGYVFDGWYRESTFATKWNFDTSTVTGNTTLYAKWGYIVTFDAKSGSPAPAQQVVVNGGKVTAPAAMTNTGFTFDGWYTENTFDTKWDFAIDTITGNTTLYAKWGYTVTFNANSGSPTPAAQIVVNGDKAMEPPAMTRTGYAFDGWYTESTFTAKWNFSIDTVTGNITLYAKWSYNAVITFAEIADAAPSITGPIISRSGGTSATITVENPSQYTSIAWYVTGTTLSGTGSSFTLNWDNTAHLYPGSHQLTVEVIKGGVPYNKTVIFTLVP